MATVAPPAKTEISDTYPNPSNAVARVGFGKLYDYVVNLLGTVGSPATALTALGAAADAVVVKLTGAQTIAGLKAFSTLPNGLKVIDAAQATTTGTFKDSGAIPSYATEVNIFLMGVKTSGTSPAGIQLIDAGGVEATGYSGAAGDLVGTAAALNSTMFAISTSANAATIYDGVITLKRASASSSLWVASGVVGRSDGAQVYFVSGSKTTTQDLTNVRFTTVSGVPTFTAGSINFSWS